MPEIDLTDPGVTGAQLSFFQAHDIELTFDFGTVRVVDAASGVQLGTELFMRVEGTELDWQQRSAPLPPEALGNTIRLEFRLTTDEFGEVAGWYIDDVLLTLQLGN